MNFIPTISSPHYFMFFLTADTYILPPVPNIDALQTNSASNSLQSRIIVTREDLLREGYEQTKKAWTEE
jgi:hypothetical protein